VVLGSVLGGRRDGRQGLLAGGRRLCARDLVLLDLKLENLVPPRLGAIGVRERVVALGLGDQPGE